MVWWRMMNPIDFSAYLYMVWGYSAVRAACLIVSRYLAQLKWQLWNTRGNLWSADSRRLTPLTPSCNSTVTLVVRPRAQEHKRKRKMQVRRWYWRITGARRPYHRRDKRLSGVQLPQEYRYLALRNPSTTWLNPAQIQALERRWVINTSPRTLIEK